MTTEKRLMKAEKVFGKNNLPKITQTDYKLNLIKVLNWHNVNTEDKALRRALVSYLKTSGKTDYVPAVESANDNAIRQLAVLAIHSQNGDYISPSHLEYMKTTLNALKESHKAPVVAIKPVAKPKKEIDKVMEQAKAIASSVDEEIDLMYTKKSSGQFSIDVLLKTSKATESVSKKIASFYTNQIQELKDYIKGDVDLKEAYSITKPHAKRILTFLESVVGACTQNAISIKAEKVRKPRAKKKKSPKVLVAKLQFMKEEPALKLKSIDPTQVIGAKQLWTYNTKYKKLTKYLADSSEGLTVKGTTVIGFSLDDSEVKTVRKPELVFADVNKKSLSFHLKKMKTKSGVVNGRINKDTILLTV